MSTRKKTRTQARNIDDVLVGPLLPLRGRTVWRARYCTVVVLHNILLPRSRVCKLAAASRLLLHWFLEAGGCATEYLLLLLLLLCSKEVPGDGLSKKIIKLKFLCFTWTAPSRIP